MVIPLGNPSLTSNTPLTACRTEFVQLSSCRVAPRPPGLEKEGKNLFQDFFSASKAALANPWFMC